MSDKKPAQARLNQLIYKFSHQQTGLPTAETPDLEPVFNGERLAQARELRRFTRAELADELGRLKQEVVLWESKDAQPPADVIDALGHILDFPVTFFYRADPPQFGSGRSGPGNSLNWH